MNEAINTVKNWLSDHEISGDRVKLLRGSNWVQSHVDFIMPTIQFDVILRKPSSCRELSKRARSATPAVDLPFPRIH
jgi:hypothetical protein